MIIDLTSYYLFYVISDVSQYIEIMKQANTETNRHIEINRLFLEPDRFIMVDYELNLILLYC